MRPHRSLRGIGHPVAPVLTAPVSAFLWFLVPLHSDHLATSRQQFLQSHIDPIDHANRLFRRGCGLSTDRHMFHRMRNFFPEGFGYCRIFRFTCRESEQAIDDQFFWHHPLRRIAWADGFGSQSRKVIPKAGVLGLKQKFDTRILQHDPEITHQ